MDKVQLRKAQLLQLKIAKEIARVCDKNRISYFISAGTMLGAVRHQGFIPWDDDMDIGMLRSSFERFLACCKKDLRPEFFLQTWDSDPNYLSIAAKVRLRGTVYIEKDSPQGQIENGLFVDVFPFDAVPLSDSAFKWQVVVYYAYLGMLYAKSGYVVWTNGSVEKKWLYAILCVLSFPLSRSFLRRRIQVLVTRYNGTDPARYTSYGGAYGPKKEALKKEWLTSLKAYRFEDTEFPGSQDSQAYMSYFYGDYLQFPPETERYNRHGVSILDFGEY